MEDDNRRRRDKDLDDVVSVIEKARYEITEAIRPPDRLDAKDRLLTEVKVLQHLVDAVGVSMVIGMVILAIPLFFLAVQHGCK